MELTVAAGIRPAVAQRVQEAYSLCVKNGCDDNEVAFLARLVSPGAVPGWERLEQRLKRSGRLDQAQVDLLLADIHLMQVMIWCRTFRVEKAAEARARWRERRELAVIMAREAELFEAVGRQEAEDAWRLARFYSEASEATYRDIEEGTFIIERDRRQRFRRELLGFVFALKKHFETCLGQPPLNDVIACFASMVFGFNVTTRQIVDMTRGRKPGR